MFVTTIWVLKVIDLMRVDPVNIMPQAPQDVMFTKVYSYIDQVQELAENN
jgi:hypothetical protein